MIQLTDEEIQKTFDTFLKEHPEAQWDSIMMCRAQNKAQLKQSLDEVEAYIERDLEWASEEDEMLWKKKLAIWRQEIGC